jgi:N-methylhydantoinase B
VGDRPVHAKGRVEIEPGATMRVVEAGGAGYGDPKARDRKAVEADVANGFVRPEAAERLYGHQKS